MENITVTRTAYHAKTFKPEYIPSASKQGVVDLNWDEDKNKVAEQAMKAAMERRRKEKQPRGK